MSEQKISEFRERAQMAVAAPDPDLLLQRGRTLRRRRQLVPVVALAACAAIGIGFLASGGGGARTDQPPVDRENQELVPAPRTDGVVWAAEWGTTSTRVTNVEPSMTLPREVELLQDPHTEPLPVWSAFDQETGGFLWTDLPEHPDVVGGSVGVRTLMVLSPGADPELAQISCPGGCSDLVSFGPAPDEVTVLVGDLSKDPVNGGWPASIARVYGIDGSLRDEIDLGEVIGTERHVLEETNDWAPPDGSEAVIADIEWAPDGTRLAVSTHPGFFRPACPPAALPCEGLVWTFDRDGGDPVLVHRQASDAHDRGVWQAPILTNLAWTSDGSRLGMVLVSGIFEPAKRSPRLVRLDVESGSASTLHEFSECAYCRPLRYGFTWSPEGTRLAVTSGEGVSVLDSDGTVLSESADGGPGPLAWLVQGR